MIKLGKRNQSTKTERYYLLERLDSVSPDYIGLQVTFGFANKSGRTLHYWFKNKKNKRGKTLTARLQMNRKVNYLVLRRLRNGYRFKRKCDYWCRSAIDRSLATASRPKKVQVPMQPATKAPVQSVAEVQLCFNF